MPTASPVPTTPTTTERVELLRVLAEPTRLLMVELLASGPLTVTEIHEKLNLPQPTASHHLGLLRMNRVIKHERDGKRIFYSLSDVVTVTARGILFPQGITLTR